MVLKLLAGVFLSVLTLAVSTQVFAQADVIQKRQDAMKGNSAQAKAIKGAVEAKDYATVEAKAKDIMGTADKIVSLFPKGSTTGKTKAKPEIWEKPDEFSKDAKNLSKAASELASAAKAGNAADVDVKVKALGEACNSCHKQFRAEKYTE
ncbi:MAG TPA: cytochrome c [Candidatus Binatia bacterium]|nr:cytochrome c [Candidatus Binatia bacterium]